jgi:hypothetical protein
MGRFRPYFNLLKAWRESGWEHELGANAVFLCDLLDSFFQMSPFSLLSERNLTFQRPFNTSWRTARFQKFCPSSPENGIVKP